MLKLSIEIERIGCVTLPHATANEPLTSKPQSIDSAGVSAEHQSFNRFKRTVTRGPETLINCVSIALCEWCAPVQRPALDMVEAVICMETISRDTKVRLGAVAVLVLGLLGEQILVLCPDGLQA